METITSELIDKTMNIAGASASIIGLAILLGIIKGVWDFAGDPGKSIKSWRGQGLRDRAQTLGDTIGQNREAAALKKGGFARALRPGAGGRQKRDLRSKAAQARLEEAQGEYGRTNKTAREYTQSIMDNKALSSATSNANNTDLVNRLAKNPSYLTSMLGEKGQKDETLGQAMAAQQERAVAEAIKDVELNATVKPGDVADMAKKMAEAVKNGDSIGARAYQNMLLKSGGPGTEEYRKVMRDNPNLNSTEAANSATMQSLKQNLLTNHAGVKETAADLVKHASAKPKDDGSYKTLGEVTSDAGTWNMSSEELVKQKSHSLREAENAGGISQEQAKAIQGDTQLYRKLDAAGKTIIDRAATTVGEAHEEAVVQNALHDMENRK